MINAEVPQCRLGYPRGQLEVMLGVRIAAFDQWMTGQTFAICDVGAPCGPHGFVWYTHDVRRFLAGLPVVD